MPTVAATAPAIVGTKLSKRYVPTVPTGCSNTGALRNQGFVQVATALQTQDGQKWLSGMRSVSDLYHAMGMMIDSEVYDRWLAEEKAKDTRLEKLANLPKMCTTRLLDISWNTKSKESGTESASNV